MNDNTRTIRYVRTATRKLIDQDIRKGFTLEASEFHIRSEANQQELRRLAWEELEKGTRSIFIPRIVVKRFLNGE